MRIFRGVVVPAAVVILVLRFMALWLSSQ